MASVALSLSKVGNVVGFDHTCLLDYDSPRSDSLMKSLDEINYRYGSSTLRLAAEGVGKNWQMRREKVSPCYTTCFDELMTVKS